MQAVVRIARQIAEAMSCLHANGIVHGVRKTYFLPSLQSGPIPTLLSSHVCVFHSFAAFVPLQYISLRRSAGILRTALSGPCPVIACAALWTMYRNQHHCGSAPLEHVGPSLLVRLKSLYGQPLRPCGSTAGTCTCSKYGLVLYFWFRPIPTPSLRPGGWVAGDLQTSSYSPDLYFYFQPTLTQLLRPSGCAAGGHVTACTALLCTSLFDRWLPSY